MRALKSVEQAAGLLGISRWTVRSYVKTGKLRAVRLGRRVLVEQAELERLIADGKVLLGDAQGPDDKGATEAHLRGGHV